jgi:hypothetical protein
MKKFELLSFHSTRERIGQKNISSHRTFNGLSQDGRRAELLKISAPHPLMNSVKRRYFSFRWTVPLQAAATPYTDMLTRGNVCIFL